MPAHYDGKRSEQRLTAVCPATEYERSRTLHFAGLLARVNKNFVEKRPTGVVFLGVCSDLRSRSSGRTQLQAGHPPSITLSAGYLPTYFNGWFKRPAAHAHRLFVAYELRFCSACAWTTCQLSPATSVGAQDEWHDLHRHVLPADIPRQLPGDILPLSSAGYRAEDCCRQVEYYITAKLSLSSTSCIRRPRAVQLLRLLQLNIVWWPSVHSWSVPLNANQARNKTSKKVAYLSEAVFQLYELCCELCVTIWSFVARTRFWKLLVL
jgi:hypothetical protein